MRGLGQISNAVNWSLANPCYGADFVGPMPSGSQVCVNAAGQLLNSDGSPVTSSVSSGSAASGSNPAQPDYTYLLYAAFGLIGLLILVKVARL